MATHPAPPRRTGGPTRGGVVAATATVLAVLMTCAASGGRPDPYPTPAAPAPPADPECERLAVVSAAKHVVARDVAAGRTSLPEAAALFARLDALRPTTPDASGIPATAARMGLADDRGDYTGPERLWLQAMVWAVDQAGAECPDRVAEVTARLRGEFLAARRAEGLPAVSDAACREVLDRAGAEADRLKTGR